MLIKKGPERRGAFQAGEGEFTENSERAPVSILHLLRGGFCAIPNIRPGLSPRPFLAQGINVMKFRYKVHREVSAFLP